MNRNKNASLAERSNSNPGSFAFQKTVESSDCIRTTGKPLSSYIDYAVSEVMTGPLSRGVSNKDRRHQTQLMLMQAEAENRTEFKLGMIHGLRILLNQPSGTEWDGLLKQAGTNRTSKDYRSSWREGLKFTPHVVRHGEEVLDFESASEEQVDEFNAGQVGVALALSGLEHEYDLSRAAARHEPSLETECYEDEDSNIVFTQNFGDREFEIDRPDPDDDFYAVYEGDTQVATFYCSADPEDHFEIWNEALQSLVEAGEATTCSECMSEPPVEGQSTCRDC